MSRKYGNGSFTDSGSAPEAEYGAVYITGK